MSLALIFSLVAAGCYAGLVVLVLRRGRRIGVERLFALYLMTMLVWQSAYIAVCLSKTADLALLSYRIMAAAAASQCVILFYFARALIRARDPRIVQFAGLVTLAITVVVVLADHPYIMPSAYRSEETALFVPSFGPLVALVAVVSGAFILASVASLIQGYGEATSELARNRLRYLLVATTIAPLGGITNFLPGLTGYPVDVTINIVSALVLSYAFLRYRLFDITIVVRRGLAYSALTALIAGVYLLSVLLFERLVRAAMGLGAFLLPVGLAMIAAILLQPWRDKIQAWVDRLFFREQYDSRRMLQRLSRQAASIIDLDVLANLLLSEICETMHIERAALFLHPSSAHDGFAIVAQRGLDEDMEGLRLGEDHPIVQWLAHTDRLLRSQDLDMLPQFRGLWGQERKELSRLDARLFLPLQVKQELVGILAVGGKLSGEAHSADDEIALWTLANQAAVAVENAHLFAATKARLAELTTLQEIGVQLVSSRYLDRVLRVVAASGVRLLAADEAFVVLYDARRDRFGAHCEFSVDDEEPLPAWDAIAALPLHAAARSGKPAAIEDLWLEVSVPPALARAGRMRALAVQPLQRDESTIAVLGVAFRQPHTFSDDELRLLGMLADQATLAIDNAQLLESEQAKRQLADTLCQVSRVVGSTLQMDVLLDLVLEQLQNVVDYDMAAIMLLAADGLEVSAARGTPSITGAVGTIVRLSDHPVLKEVIEEHKPVVLRDAGRGGGLWGMPEDARVQAVIGVPLMVRGELRGVLVVGHRNEGYYDEDDLQGAAAFANQAALAIENARLYQETIVEKGKTETILRESLSGIVVTDLDLRIVTFNSGAEAITGFAADDVLGARLPDVFGPGIVAEGSPLGEVISTGRRVAPQEMVIQAATGLRDILQGSVALYDAGQRLFGYLLSFADITRLKEVDRLKSDIVANVSHELRTPLASIKAYTELLIDNVEGEDRELRDQFLHTIDLEADRLAQLISDLLDLSRLEAGRFTVRRVKLDPADVLSNVLSALDMQRRGRQVTIQAELPDNLPELYADREMVTIIMRNLLANAIKFSQQGGRVVIALRPTPEHLVIEVSDHGIGIPADALPHLFQKFYRSPMASEMGIEGTGLGLVLTKEAAEAHGGTISVESEPNVRTVFTVRLPWR